MSCLCVHDGDYDSPSVFDEKIVRARKPHKCCECEEAIDPGEHYERVSGLWDGEWGRYETCMPCARMRSDLCNCGFIYGDLREMIREELGFDYVTGVTY